MKKIADLILQNHKMAMLVAFVCASIPLLRSFPILSLIGWIALVVVAFITLRQGARAGLQIVVAAAVPSMIVALQGDLGPILYFVAGGSLMIWGLAWVLRDINSWAWILQGVMGLALAGVVMIHWFYPDIVNFWQAQYTAIFAHLEQEVGKSDSLDFLQQNIYLYATVSTGVYLSSVCLINVMLLGFARAWQAMLFNPGGLRKELYKIRLHNISSVILFACVLGTAMGSIIARDMLAPVLLPFILAGLSLTHCFAKSVRYGNWILASFYILLLLFLQFMFVLAAIAVTDSLLNLRKYLNHPT